MIERETGAFSVGERGLVEGDVEIRAGKPFGLLRLGKLFGGEDPRDVLEVLLRRAQESHA